MVDEMIRQMSKKTWYKWSIYINIALFFLVGVFIYFTIIHTISAARIGGDTWWLTVAADIAVLSIILALIFFQFFRNLFVIMRRSL